MGKREWAGRFRRLGNGRRHRPWTEGSSTQMAAPRERLPGCTARRGEIERPEGKGLHGEKRLPGAPQCPHYITPRLRSYLDPTFPPADRHRRSQAQAALDLRCPLSLPPESPLALCCCPSGLPHRVREGEPVRITYSCS